jgi:hypothetical protein
VLKTRLQPVADIMRQLMAEAEAALARARS